MSRYNAPSAYSHTQRPDHIHAARSEQKLRARRGTHRSADEQRFRSQPIRGKPPQQTFEPTTLPPAWEEERPGEPWRDKPLLIILALLAWLTALAFLLTTPSSVAQIGALPRLLTPLVWGLAGGVTFLPLQKRLGLRDIGWQGIVGWGLLGYLLAFVPAPSGSLFDLPEVPVYLLFYIAIFYATTTATMPLIYLLSQHFHKRPLHGGELHQIRRQAYCVGLFVVAVLVLAGLRMLSPATLGLTFLVLVLTEGLLLSQVQSSR